LRSKEPRRTGLYRPLNQYYMEAKKANSRKRKINIKDRKIDTGFPEPEVETKKNKKHYSDTFNKRKKQFSGNIFLYSYPLRQRFRSNSFYRVIQL
jgi:hypothetical protein